MIDSSLEIESSTQNGQNNKLSFPLESNLLEEERVMNSNHKDDHQTRESQNPQKLLPEEVFRYEKQVLDDPFEESDGEGNENASSIGSSISTTQLEQNETHTEPPCNSNSLPSSSNMSGHYFIDASTLSDEIDISTQKQVKPNHTTSSKFTIFKSCNFYIGRENVAEFERELKHVEYSQSIKDEYKLKKIDPITGTSKKNETILDKESLAVEIKENDSGESTQHSPCPDNYKESSNQSSQPSLIRGNTFELDSNTEKLSNLRQEYERRQGSLVFKNAIPQYSTHRVDGDSYFPINYHSLSTKYNAKPSSSLENYNYDDSYVTKIYSKSSEFNSMHRKDEISSGSTSLPITLNNTIEKLTCIDSLKRTKHHEATPILSGGVSTSDYSKPLDSPTVRRRTESTPIVSGGSVIMNKSENRPKSTKLSSSMVAWVVDMSDCNKSPPQSAMSQSLSTPGCVKDKSLINGFGSSMNNLKKIQPTEQSDESSCKFYVDISKKNEQGRSNVEGVKKNIFSMYIDLNSPNKMIDKDQTSMATNGTKTIENEEETNSKEKVKPSVFMFIESDSPVVRRRTLSSTRSTLKRHSWNVEKISMNDSPIASVPTTSTTINNVNTFINVPKELISRKQHKRAYSLSMDCKDAKKLQAKLSSSDRSLNDTAMMEVGQLNIENHLEEALEFNARDTPPNSHIELSNEELRSNVKQREYMKLNTKEGTNNTLEDESSEISPWDKTCTESTEEGTRKSETFDISSACESSPESSDNRDFHFSNLMNPSVPNKISETHESLNATIKKIESEFREPEVKENNTKNFVKLSDLDRTSKPYHAFEIFIGKEEQCSHRMSKSIPETSWIESKLGSNGPIRTLPRKFTTLMSTSLPPKQKSPFEDITTDAEADCIVSESDLSSMQSSIGRSGAGSTEETETSSLAGGKPYNRLGEDLLRMFLEEINPDVTIDVAGRHIKAHKCILSSRCQYFAAILSGGWIETSGNVISLQGYSFQAVHFALCHIYSGESNIPDSISIVELATLADMLCLEGLKEVIGYTLKVKYCHLFHKPCQVCTVGVLECMPLAAAYGLDEIYRKSLRWITKYFVRIWPCKAFATLPKELMDKCYHQHIVHMSADNILQTMMDCEKLLATLPNVRWAEPVFKMVSNLLEMCIKFLSNNFVNILSNEHFLSLGRDLSWNISRLEGNILLAAENLTPEQACKSYSKLHKMLITLQSEDPINKIKWSPLFIEFVKNIQNHVEKFLIKDATRAAKTIAWLKMDLELRRRIQELACLVILPHEMVNRQSRHANFIKDLGTTSNRTTNRSLDLKRVKMVISEHNEKTLRQTGVANQTKKLPNKPKSDPLIRKVQDHKPIETWNKPKPWTNKIKVKSRYLEPRHDITTRNINSTNANPDKSLLPQQRKIMIISSSDSSRTSSPALKSNTEKTPLTKIKLSIKKETQTLSSDSLIERKIEKSSNLKTNVTLLSKSCGITRPESPSSLKQKRKDIGLSVDSLTESKKKPNSNSISKKNINQMDTSMSADSLMTEIHSTPKSTNSTKLSPILKKGIMKTPNLIKEKKTYNTGQQKSPIAALRKPQRSLENSTAASRSRAAAISAHHGLPNLRKNLLDAAKTPDLAFNRTHNVVPCTINNVKSTHQNVAILNSKKEKKIYSTTSNQASSENSSKKSSPKLSSANNRPKIMTNNKKGTAINRMGNESKSKVKCHNADIIKQPTVASRSGTFLKDEPTVLKKGGYQNAT